MADPRDSALARKLDAFTVPALPTDFAGRVLAQALAQPGVGQTNVASLPKLRTMPPRRRWLRAGGIGLSVIAAGMISISAAAAGLFGDPVRMAVHDAPVIGKAISRVIPDRPRHRLAAKPVEVKVQPSPALAESTASSATLATEGQRIRPARISPEQRQAWLDAHPKAARRIERRREWIAAHPEEAQRIAERIEQVKAERIERRREWRRRMRAAREAAQAEGTSSAVMNAEPMPLRRAQRLERLRQRLEQRAAQAQPVPNH